MNKSHFSIRETNLGEPIPVREELHIQNEEEEAWFSKAKRKVMNVGLDAQGLGNILTALQIIAMLAGGFYFLWRMEARLQVLVSVQNSFADRLNKVDNKLELLAGATIQLAKQEVRMDATDNRVQELSNRIEGMTHIYEFGFSGNKLKRTKTKINKD